MSIIHIMWTNKMHYQYFLLIYFNNKPLHVLSRLAVLLSLFSSSLFYLCNIRIIWFVDFWFIIDKKNLKQSVSIVRWKGKKVPTQVHLIDSIKTAHNFHNKYKCLTPWEWNHCIYICPENVNLNWIWRQLH
jgi:hypothetical protein